MEPDPGGMMRGGVRAVTAAAMTLALVGCGRDANLGLQPTSPPSRAVTSAAATIMPTVTPPNGEGADLVPSGWTLAGVPDSEPSYRDWSWGIVADGAGQIWVRGPWQVSRLDPLTGQATVWDASDDLQFASTSMRMAPASGSGVWLLDGARVRLFDGQRFAVDVKVPHTVRNLPGGPDSDGWVTDAVQVGSELWVSVVDAAGGDDEDDPELGTHPGSGGQVARLAHGQWSVMSEPNQDVGGYLTADRDGAVWAGGVILPSSFADTKVGGLRRWDGHGWSLPGAHDGAPTDAGDVAADPTGGVWFISGADGLQHFDGSTWTTPVPDLYTKTDESWQTTSAALAVSSSGTAWLAAGDALRQVSAAGVIHEFEAASSVAIGANDSVLTQRIPSVLRLDGERFTQIWQGMTAPLWGSDGPGMGAYAPSDDEVWVRVEDTWYRMRDGAWDELGAGLGCSAVASDGALWTYGGEGELARITSDGYRTVGDRGVLCEYGAGTFPGPHGSVWVIQDGDVVQIGPDGRQRSIGRPRRTDGYLEDYEPEDQDRVCLHGVDPAGSVWVSEFSDSDDEECTAGTWHRWDGRRWRAAQGPDPFTSAQEKVISGDGVGWLLRSGRGGTSTEIVRWADGRLVRVASAPRLSALTAVGGGRACAFEHGDRDSIDILAIACYDARGRIARYRVDGMVDFDSQYAVGPDGSVWLVGPQVARLAPSLPAP